MNFFFLSEDFFSPVGHIFGRRKFYGLASRHAHDWRMRSGRVLLAFEMETSINRVGHFYVRDNLMGRHAYDRRM